MTKSDDLLAELDAEIPEYIKKIGEFYVKLIGEHGGKFHMVKHYTSSSYRTCAACHKPNILEIFVVEDAEGNQYEVGSDCILSVGNENLLGIFKVNDRKRENVTNNRETIDFLDDILNAIEDGTEPIHISKIGIQRLTQMYERMCNGLNPLETQTRLLDSYVNRIIREQSQ